MSAQGAVIIPAAGSGSRMKSSCPKQYLILAGRPVLIHTVSAFHRHPEITLIIVVVPRDHVESTRRLLQTWKVDTKTEVIEGGIRRQDSVKNGLDQLGDRCPTVLVHDGARPMVKQELISNCLTAAGLGAAIAAIPVKDTLKRGNNTNIITATVDRTDLWQAQTPQGARVSTLRHAFAEAGGRDVTDEASLLEMAGIDVQLVMGSETNIKITRPEDLLIAEKILTGKGMNENRIGHGFDAHRLVQGRPLVLGGVEIEHTTGLAGHSDADVVTHAVCDALLGALGEGDIGKHFPDSSSEFKDIYSIKLLEKVVKTMFAKGYSLGNCDVTIICQAPKLAPYIAAMRKILSESCGAPTERINIKATTTETMGYTGREEGISCHAVVLLIKQ